MTSRHGPRHDLCARRREGHSCHDLVRQARPRHSLERTRGLVRVQRHAIVVADFSKYQYKHFFGARHERYIVAFHVLYAKLERGFVYELINLGVGILWQ